MYWGIIQMLEANRKTLDSLLWTFSMPEEVLNKLGYTKPISSRYSTPYETNVFIARNKYDTRVHEFIIDKNEFLFPNIICYRKVGEFTHEY